MQSNFIFFIAGKNGIVVYDLFDLSNKTVSGLNNLGDEYLPQLRFNESEEEFYIIHDDKICLYLYKSMFKSLVSHFSSIIAQPYTKSQLIEMRLPQHVYKYLNLFW